LGGLGGPVNIGIAKFSLDKLMDARRAGKTVTLEVA